MFKEDCWSWVINKNVYGGFIIATKYFEDGYNTVAKYFVIFKSMKFSVSILYGFPNILQITEGTVKCIN